MAARHFENRQMVTVQIPATLMPMFLRMLSYGRQAVSASEVKQGSIVPQMDAILDIATDASSRLHHEITKRGLENILQTPHQYIEAVLNN